MDYNNYIWNNNIRNSHACVALTECSGSCLSLFLFSWNPTVISDSINGFWKFYQSAEKIFQGNILYKRFQIASCTKLSIFSTKSKMMIKVVKLFTALMNFMGKHLCRSLFLVKFHTYRLKKDSCSGVFLWGLPNLSGSFFAKHLWVTAFAKYPFLFVTSTSATKIVSFGLGYFKYFRDKHRELLANSS